MLSWQQLIEYVRTDLVLNGSRNMKAFRYQTPHIRRLLGHVRPDNARYDDLQGYCVRRIEEGAKPKTINNELTWIRKCLREGARRGLIPRPPKIENLAVGDNARRGFCTPSELERIVANLTQEAVQDVTRFAYYTGWRKGEILTLEWDDIDFDAEVIRLRPRNDKEKQGRVFPFGVRLGEVLCRRRKASGPTTKRPACSLVFHRDGEPIRCFAYQWAVAVAAAGRRGLVFHDLRRSFSRNARNAGIPERVVMALMGHSTNAMFVRYNIVDEADLRAHTIALEEFLGHHDEEGGEDGEGEGPGAVRRIS